MNEKYLPKQLKQHPEYVDYQDIITVFFDPDRFYTLEEADRKLKQILSREVDD